MANEQINLFGQQGKACRTCGVEKPFSEYTKNGRWLNRDCKPCVAAKSRERHAKNPTEYAAKRQEWRDNNKERTKERVAKWQAENPERHKANMLAWARANADKENERTRKWRENNKELNKEIQKAWDKAHPDMVAAKAARRRAAKRQAIPNWLNVAHFVEIEGYYQWCSIFPGHHVDHIYPLQSPKVAGFHAPVNLQILTETENVKKHNKLPDPATIAPYIERPTLIIDADGFASLKFEE